VFNVLLIKFSKKKTPQHTETPFIEEKKIQNNKAKQK
jgi:hypothetical protein